MINGNLKAAIAGSIGLGLLLLPANAEETVQLGAVAPSFEMSTVDENGVDVLSGAIRHSIDAVSIGNSDFGLSYSVIIPSLAHAGGGGQAGSELQPIFRYNNFSGGVGGIEGVGGSDQPDCNKFFDLAGARTYFCGSINDGDGDPSNNFTPKGLGGEAFSYDDSTGLFLFVDASGTQYISKSGIASRRSESNDYGLQKIIYPNGEVINIYRSANLVTYESSTGFSIREQTNDDWETSTVTAYNRAVDYCAPDAQTCSFTYDWPMATIYAGPGPTSSEAYVEDMAGQRAIYYPRDRTNGYAGYHYYKVKPAGAEQTATISYEFCAPWYVSCAMTCATSHPNPPPQCLSGEMAKWKVRKAVKAGKEWVYDYAYDIY